MIVSRSRKFVFVHIPKNAGTSITKALEPFASRRGLFRRYDTHETMSEIVARRPQAFDGFFKFAVVRNPWDRMVSFYSFYRKRRNIPEMEDIQDFRTFLAAFDRRAGWMENRNLVKLQLDYIRDRNGDLLVDFVGRYERLEQDFAAVCDRLGLAVRLGALNKTAHDHYTSYYDQWGRDLIERRFAEDIAAFGYQFR